MDILSKIKQPISGESAVGHALLDDEQLNFIDDEMMKVGSLSHGSIEWKKVEESALDLLHTKTKDIKLLANLLQCLQQDAQLEGILQSLKVFSVFIGAYWLDAYPTPRDKGKSTRARLYKQIMQRNCKALKRVEINAADEQEIAQVLGELEKVLKDALLDLAPLNSLTLAFKDRQMQPSEEVLKPAIDGDDDNGDQIEAPQVPKVYFDAKNERATRQSLFNMANFLNTTDATAEIGYRVRRNALWFSIWQLPGTKQEKVTELAAFSPERYSDYVGQIEKQPSLALLNKIERSIEQSPYWFDGQHLSYQLCQKLQYSKVAASIKQELQNFVERLPEILSYQSQDSTPFASDQTKQWLNQHDSNNSDLAPGNNVDNDWQAQFQALVQISEERGLVEALAHINSKLIIASNAREAHYWRLLSADLLNHQQLTALAKNEYQVLLNNIKGMSVVDWEPSFSGHIQQTLEIMDNSGL